MDRNLLHNPIIDSLVIWCKEVPINVICVLWRAVQCRILFVVSLASRGLPIHSIAFGLCGESLECAHDVLVECSLAQSV